MKKLTPIKFSIILTTVALVLLIGFAIMLPWLVTWYVKIMGRHENIATVVMVTCYPCTPFTAVILLSLRKMLKSISAGNLEKSANSKLLMYMTVSCFIISAITLIAGKFYMPFFIVAATFVFLAVIIFAFKNITDELFADK